MLAITTATLLEGCTRVPDGATALMGDALRIMPHPHAQQVRARFTCQNIGSHTLRVVALAPADPPHPGDLRHAVHRPRPAGLCGYRRGPE